MNKTLSLIKSVCPFIGLALIIVMVTVTFSPFWISFFVILDYLLAILIFGLQKYSKKTSLVLYNHNSFIFFGNLTCGIAISATRSFLSVRDYNEHIKVIRIIGDWICNENSICGFFSTVLFGFAILFFCKQHISRATEVAARYCLDGMNSKLFDIDQKLIKQEITENEANLQKEKVRANVDYYGHIDYASNYLLWTIKAFIGLFCIIVLGGFANGIIELKLSWGESLSQYINLSSGFFIVFLIPIFIVSLSLRTKIE